MSNRNIRVVRNRDKNNNTFGNKTIIAKLAIVLIIVLIIIAIVVICVKNSKTNNFSLSEKTDELYEYFLLSSGEFVGIIDKSGNEIIEAKYLHIDIPNPSKDVFLCYQDDKNCKILNKDGKEVLSQYKEIDIIKSLGENNEIERDILKYKNNDLYGIIDLDGNVVTEPIYQEISSLNYRPGAILVKKDDKYGIIDSNGNYVIDVKYDSISADGYCDQNELYAKTGYIISEKKDNGVNFGYIDYNGNMVLDVKYESIERALKYEDEDIYLIVMQNGKKGVFKNKKKIIDLNFQDINYSITSNVFIVNKNGKYGFYNNFGKTILKPEYTQYSIAGNYISVKKDDKTQLFDINGNLVNTNSYTKMIETENPAYFIAEDEEGYYSIISKDVKIDDKYIQVSYAFNNYFIFTDNLGKVGVVNAITNEIEIEPRYDFIIVIDGTKALQAVDGMNNLIDIYSENLEKTISMEDAIVNSIENGYVVVYSENDIKYINSEGNIVENTEVNKNKKLYAIQKDGKWGFGDSSKKEIIKCDYDIVTELNEYGFAGVKKDGKWGVINENGDIIVEPTYELDTYYFPKFIGKYLLVESEITYCEDITL